MLMLYLESTPKIILGEATPPIRLWFAAAEHPHLIRRCETTGFLASRPLLPPKNLKNS